MQPNCLLGIAEVWMCSKENHTYVRVMTGDPVREFQPTFLRHFNICDHEVDFKIRNDKFCLHGTARSENTVYTDAVPVYPALNTLYDCFLIIYQ